MKREVRVKVCGITRPEDASAALRAGADKIGLNLYAGSPRGISLERARKLLIDIPRGRRVMVDVETAPERLVEYQQCGFDFFQIHFDVSAGRNKVSAWSKVVSSKCLWLAPRLPQGEPFPEWLLEFADTILFDAYAPDVYGGSGKTGDWSRFAELQEKFMKKTWVLAGGLSPDNIAEALRVSQARFVDVNSGVESAPGIKDAGKIERFILEVRRMKDER